MSIYYWIRKLVSSNTFPLQSLKVVFFFSLFLCPLSIYAALMNIINYVSESKEPMHALLFVNLLINSA